jgi:hypothetical protein
VTTGISPARQGHPAGAGPARGKPATTVVALPYRLPGLVYIVFIPATHR